ncbi:MULTISPECIES: hypothetical protein [unclassified Campylobacter]|uniref:hypothetical protein n=1 Tax=unclassified Campylobacter TaxID=2593542 RepID=UPI001BDA75C7|nr:MULTISPECIES: hypothetical protein [unclassified Campylobacter]MBZ7975937.1 hypothetical protein [Campylobacter sp. RM12637]MBZ7977507.1 hypothetical protein [Campylobacter sp. RM12654]MBZ7979524.1 hypothetical protein [Campylobacter sp. RM12642]MBZ7981159.1 hypothetical protein [Campylobacter sp. RM12640]MBZ7983000.1 hypothetical protein [Campylobacter sp. RM12647]MBZ7988718.1 hypothetical protein [Campylobacter sp. RM12635]MBZ7990410.1 hypothetical protein [Campylobacter sp. RM9331]MBZ
MKNIRTSTEEKEELLINKYQDYSILGFNKRLILLFFIIMIISISLVWVRLQLYESSKVYAQLKDKREVLSEENKELKRKIEALQFKNKITNYFEVQYGTK